MYGGSKGKKLGSAKDAAQPKELLRQHKCFAMGMTQQKTVPAISRPKSSGKTA